MKRILLMVFKNILLVPVMWCKLCYYAGHVEKYTEQQIYKMLTFIVLRANKGGRVTIDVHGKENIPEKDGFMFFPNHQGMYDVLAIVEACSHPFSVVAKKEVEKNKEDIQEKELEQLCSSETSSISPAAILKII